MHSFCAFKLLHDNIFIHELAERIILSFTKSYCTSRVYISFLILFFYFYCEIREITIVEFSSTSNRSASGPLPLEGGGRISSAQL